MTITLKNVKTHQELSEETTCFSASLYLEGKRVGTVSNRGHGGCHEYRWLGRIPLISTAADLDEKVDDLVFAAEERKALRRLCRKKTLFTLQGDEAGCFRTIDHPYGADVKAFLNRKHGTNLDRIANEEI